mgnify:CR=1 FL=1
MLNDIITEHKERMLNLKKYYPFFKLMDVSFAQFQEGRYEMLDMGYIVMGILRFFIEENNFKEKDVTYPEYLDFITSLLKRDFGLNLSAQEYKELADYIFDKIKNEGRPFTFPYYDPIEKKKCISRIKVLESAIRDHTVWYSISSDAIEFYLDTKEIKEESRISVQQLLLEKMIQAQNFQGGKDVIVRINEEVARLQRRKNEIMELLGKDVFAGIEAYEDFVHTGMRSLCSVIISFNIVSYNSVLPSNARSSVTSSIYSKSPPTGTPLAMRVTLMPVGLIRRLIYIAVVSPSRLELVAMMTSCTSPSSRFISSFNLMSDGPMPSIGLIAPCST